MKQYKPIAIGFAVLLTVALVLPSLLVLPFAEKKEGGRLDEHLALPKEPANEIKKGKPDKNMNQAVAVYRSAKKTVDKLPLESYIIGVVAAEMPADFEMEALKAQALTARTYIISQLSKSGEGGLPGGADVSDTVQHQVYMDDEDMKQAWGKDYKWKLKRIKEAVASTEGQILTYHNKPITASFFSTSNGYTENAEDYWKNEIPYLKSVPSPWDKESPKFEGRKVISVSDFEAKLGIKLKSDGDIGTITARTPGKRIGKITIAGKEFTGREVREKLDLRSSDFTWMQKGSQIVITTKGYGHGVGMSQYGANGMAMEGKNFKQIVSYYYNGVEVADADSVLKGKLTARR